MKLHEVARELALTDLTRDPRLGARELCGVHVSDLLSEILAHAPQGGVAVTMQAHLNAVAVAINAGLAGVIFTAGRSPAADVVERARVEGVALYATSASTFEVAGRLWALGLHGGRR